MVVFYFSNTMQTDKLLITSKSTSIWLRINLPLPQGRAGLVGVLLCIAEHCAFAICTVKSDETLGRNALPSSLSTLRIVCYCWHFCPWVEEFDAAFIGSVAICRW